MHHALSSSCFPESHAALWPCPNTSRWSWCQFSARLTERLYLTIRTAASTTYPAWSTHVGNAQNGHEVIPWLRGIQNSGHWRHRQAGTYVRSDGLRGWPCVGAQSRRIPFCAARRCDSGTNRPGSSSYFANILLLAGIADQRRYLIVCR
jgi:hypothetical protein